MDTHEELQSNVLADADPIFFLWKIENRTHDKNMAKTQLTIDTLDIASKIRFPSNAKFLIGLPLKDLEHDAEYERSYHSGIQLQNCTPSKLFPRA